MDNLLPEFTKIKSNEPSTTQTLAQFDVTLSQARAQTPEKSAKCTGQGVIADLLNWANVSTIRGRGLHWMRDEVCCTHLSPPCFPTATGGPPPTG